MFRYALMLTVLLAGAPFVHAAEDAASAPAATAAAPMSEGEIKKIDTAAGKLTIKHGPLENLGMEPMTMVFRVQDPAMLTKVHVGSKVRFVAEKVSGALTVTALDVQ
ncbi:copper-binding protein [Ralstonia chuxiongensis]|uniref:Copper-binding protein n=1 Tax=Ralstonia chuxiongensis TaxID=2957504 RepID=A0AA41WLT2_9RALS|nr:copper-binding protein [Ralstonia chuxiongensis]MCP1171460.1 copper-binding protein [Ralstonia chuxiongensis]